MRKLAGDSPLRVIMVAFTVIFFVALFVWQIDRYLAASQDSKLQAQLSKMSLMVESDSLETPMFNRYAYLHSPRDVAKPLTIEPRPGRPKPNFAPTSTLASLFVRNQFTPSRSGSDTCYVFMYFPPTHAKRMVASVTDNDSAYLIAGWSKHQEMPIVTGTSGLIPWGENVFEERHFHCEPKSLRPDRLATIEDGEMIELPGHHFQFAELYYSKVKQ